MIHVLPDRQRDRDRDRKSRVADETRNDGCGSCCEVIRVIIRYETTILQRASE